MNSENPFCLSCKALASTDKSGKRKQLQTIVQRIDIAKREGVDEGDVSRMMSFAFLAPDIVEAIVDGTQPVELTAERLKRSGTLPLPWQTSDASWGSLPKNPIQLDFAPAMVWWPKWANGDKPRIFPNIADRNASPLAVAMRNTSTTV